MMLNTFCRVASYLMQSRTLVSQARRNLRKGPYCLEISARGKRVWYICRIKPVSSENFIEPIRLKKLKWLACTEETYVCGRQLNHINTHNRSHS